LNLLRRLNVGDIHGCRLGCDRLVAVHGCATFEKAALKPSSSSRSIEAAAGG
jgi:hypothetical protein